MNPYTYIFVRQDLSKPQQIVQAAHAALVAGEKFHQPAPTNIVLIGVENQYDLLEVSQLLEYHRIEHTMFNEPDYDTGFTAIATKPLTDNRERKPLNKFKLLSD